MHKPQDIPVWVFIGDESMTRKSECKNCKTELVPPPSKSQRGIVLNSMSGQIEMVSSE